MYLPTRWKDRSSFPNSCLAPIGEARRSVLPARETGAARKSKPSPRHLKANATLAGMLTPRLNLTETRGCSTIRLITLIRGPERGTGAPAKTLSPWSANRSEIRWNVVLRAACLKFASTRFSVLRGEFRHAYATGRNRTLRYKLGTGLKLERWTGGERGVLNATNVNACVPEGTFTDLRDTQRRKSLTNAGGRLCLGTLITPSPYATGSPSCLANECELTVTF